MSKKTKGFFVKTTEQVHIGFKVACAKKGKKMTDVIEKFMMDYSKQ